MQRKSYVGLGKLILPRMRDIRRRWLREYCRETEPGLVGEQGEGDGFFGFEGHAVIVAGR